MGKNRANIRAKQMALYKVVPKTIGLGLLLIFLTACGRPTATIPSSPAPSPRPPTALPTVTAKPTIVPPSPSPGPPTARPTATPTPVSTAKALEFLPPAPLAWLDEQGSLWYAGTDDRPNHLADGVRSFKWSPDGSQMALIRKGNLYLLDVADIVEPRLLLESESLVEIAWSPTGKQIASVEELDGPSNCVIPEWTPSRILLVDVPDGHTEVLFNGPLDEGYADAGGAIQWSSNGQVVYTMRCHAVTSAILLAISVEDRTIQEVASGVWRYVLVPGRETLLVAQHRYIDTGSHRVAAEYSPDGTLLQEWPELENMLFASGQDGMVAFTEEPIYPDELAGTLYLRQLDGSILPTALDLDVDTRWRGLFLDWSSDGSWLAVQRAGKIWLVNTMTGEAHPLVYGRQPRWRPQPDRP